MSRLCLVALCIIFAFLSLGECTREKRVINGIPAPAGEYPWIVHMMSNQYCGASIINENWLLTAGHCTTDTKPEDWHLQIGQMVINKELSHEEGETQQENRDVTPDTEYEEDTSYVYEYDYWSEKKRSNGQVRSKRATSDIHVSKIIPHPQYVPNKEENGMDISLMKLSKPINFNLRQNVGPIPLAPAMSGPYWPQPGSQCVLVGWGCQTLKGDAVDTAQLLQVPVVTNDKCPSLFEGYQAVRSLICAGYTTKVTGVCPGDSGSALACKYNGRWTQAGVASYITTDKQTPDVYTRVSFHREWIDKTIAEN